MSEIIANFQFIRPLFLIAVIPVSAFYLWRLLVGKQDNLWQQIIPSHLYQGMTIQKGLAKTSKFIHFIFTASILSIVSIAGPSWEKLPQAVYQTQSGKVIIMDMSMSMRSTDLSPNRLQRAKFKAIDLINELNEGETGLIAYAGDAFVVSPLTDDATNLKTLVPALSPDIMPSQGSYALIALEQASELLKNAGYQNGEIYWITDGIRINEVNEIREFVQQSNYELSALLVGTESGAPILLDDGQMLKDSSGKIVVPSINERLLNQALANTTATYQLFTSDNSDIQAIKGNIAISQQQDAELIENTSGDAFKDMGPYLCILLLPIALYSFRKGVLAFAFIAITISVSLPMSQPAIALQTDNDANTQASPTSPEQITKPPSITLADPETQRESLVDLAFKNADQRGKIAFDNRNYSKASELFEDLSWRAASAYKNTNFELAQSLYDKLYKRSGASDDLYNKANAMAKQGQLEEALETYNKVLEQQADHEKALNNKKIIEDMLNQQQQDQQNNDNQQQDSNTDSDSDSEQSGEQQQNQDAQDQEQQNEQSSSQDKENAENQSEQNDSQNQSDQQDGQNQQQGQSPNDEQLKDQAEQRQSEQQDAEPQTPQGQSSQQNELSEEQQEAISNQINKEDLTPEEQEELQRMQMIMNKVPDDPAYLLKRKMLLEAYKRKRSQPPTAQENW